MGKLIQEKESDVITYRLYNNNEYILDFTKKYIRSEDVQNIVYEYIKENEDCIHNATILLSDMIYIYGTLPVDKSTITISHRAVLDDNKECFAVMRRVAKSLNSPSISKDDSEYKAGDLVLFRKEGLRIGLIEGYYKDDQVYWYNIRTSKTFIYTYTNKGDIGEFDIISKIDDPALKEPCLDYILDKRD
jgi:hypothetical protein